MAKATKYGNPKSARRKQRKKKGGITARRKKEFTYRGYSMEELLEMPFDEMVSLLPCRIRRTLARGMNDEQSTAFETLRTSDKEVIKTHRRAVPIPDRGGISAGKCRHSEAKIHRPVPSFAPPFSAAILL